MNSFTIASEMPWYITSPPVCNPYVTRYQYIMIHSLRGKMSQTLARFWRIMAGVNIFFPTVSPPNYFDLCIYQTRKHHSPNLWCLLFSRKCICCSRIQLPSPSFCRDVKEMQKELVFLNNTSVHNGSIVFMMSVATIPITSSVSITSKLCRLFQRYSHWWRRFLFISEWASRLYH